MMISSMANIFWLTLQYIFNLLNWGKSRAKLILLTISWVFTLIPSYVEAATWSASASSNTASTVIQSTFAIANSKYTYGVKIGPVSSSLYYFYYLYKSNPIYTSVVRKENPDGTQAWMTAVLFKPIEKSLSVDALEQNVYFASLATPSVSIVKLLTTDGSIVSTQVQ